MQILTEGHKYIAANFENKENGQTIQFIEKMPRSQAPMMSASGTDPNELITINDGTTNEELLAVLINRMNYLQGKFPCRENALAITKMEEALLWLNKRTSDRVARNVEGKQIA